MICGRLATSTANPTADRPCTLADLIVVANNVFSFILTIVFPLILAGALFYLVYSLLRNLDNPGGIAKVKSDAKSVLIGSAILLGAWSLMRIALKLMGWKGNISQPLGTLFDNSSSLFVERAYAAQFQPPLENPDVQNVIGGIINALSIGAAVMLVCALVYVGFRFIAYSDIPDKLKSTKKMLLIIAISGVTLFSAKFIINTLISTFASLDKSLGNPQQQGANTKQQEASPKQVPIDGKPTPVEGIVN